MSNVTNPKDTNPKVSDIRLLLGKIKKKGKFNELKNAPGEMTDHIQGAGLYVGKNGKEFHIFSHNTLDAGNEYGKYIIMDGSKNLVFKSYDKEYEHPAGFQVIGDYMLVSVGNKTYSGASKDNKSHTRLYDLSEMSTTAKPKIITDFDIYRDYTKIAAAGVTDYLVDGKKQYLVVGVTDSLIYLRKSINPPGTPLAESKFGGKDNESKYDLSKEQKGYNGVALITESNSVGEENVYCLCFKTDGGDECVDLYSIKIGDKQELATVQKISKSGKKSDDVVEYIRYKLDADHGSTHGPAGVHFQWSAGLIILPSGGIKILSTARNFLVHKLEVNIFSE